jgi:hypothetical protein
MLSSLCVSHVPSSAPLPVQVTVPLLKVDGEADSPGLPVVVVVEVVLGAVVVVVVVVVVGAVVGVVVVVVVVVVALGVPPAVPVLPEFPVGEVVSTALVSGAAGDEPSTPKLNAIALRSAIVTRPRATNGWLFRRRTPEGRLLSRRARRHCRRFVKTPISESLPYRQIGLSIGLLAYAASGV